MARREDPQESKTVLAFAGNSVYAFYMTVRFGYRTAADTLVNDVPYYITYVEAEERFDRTVKVNGFYTANSAVHLVLKNREELYAKFPRQGNSEDAEKEYRLAFPKAHRPV